jgi:hypothetical protein
LTQNKDTIIIQPDPTEDAQVAGFKSEPRPASVRKQWPASSWNAWPTSSESARKDFSITSGTIFASHKLPLRTYLAAIAIFANEVKGKSALALSRDLDVQYKTAFVLAHKLRESPVKNRNLLIW